jgi:SAM-dependent methyltransferase
MLKKIIKSLSPAFILKYYSQRKVKEFEGLSPKETFTKIYKENVWGGKDGDFHSGLGSDNEGTNKYADAVSDFIDKYSVKSVFDMGCGDFKVGRLLTGRNKDITYTGGDIVDDLIANNNAKFGNANISFRCIDALADELPNAELCLIRQVLQHLNNQQISLILQKVNKYKFVIITEHLLISKNVKINLDKENGPGTRLYKNSGVYLDRPPFNQQTETLLEYDEPFEIYGKIRPAVLKSYLIKN